jgi:polar amino acid transport system substrate-binding protein
VKKTSPLSARRVSFLTFAVCLWARLAHAETAGAPASASLAFTPAETAWIAEHPVVRAGHDPTYAPYAMQDAAGQVVGIDPDYLELIAQRTGLKFKHEVRRDWGRMVEDFKAGQVDLLLSLSRTASREPYLTYTRAYAAVPNVVITRSDSPYLFDLAELKGRTFGLPRGAAELRRELEVNVPGAKVVEYETAAECCEAVARGEVYASIGEVANTTYLIRTHGLAALRLGGVVAAPAEIFMGVRKDWPLLVSVLDKAIASLTADDRLRIDARWIAVSAPTGRNWVKAFKIAAGVAGALALVFLLVTFHNRRLARELAERRSVQAELEQTRDRLLRASQEKNELLHMVAHDLRGPLTAIQFGLELLQMEPPLTPANRDATTLSVNHSADQMGRLISGLLSAKNVEDGRLSINYAEGDAAKIARTASAALYPAAEHKRIGIETLLPERAVLLTTDFVALQQVVDNLLSNALKYSPPGSTVVVAVAANATHCRFEVRDQGPGVKPEERERIFEKFGRGSARPTQGEESIGLGLWIVRRFVTALHGRVWCEPRADGAGSVFVVDVPRKPPAG